MEGDDRTFRANFTSEGVVKLRERVEEKLKEFMGDYTDDTLVEYVIVLLKNGRRKDEAKSELNVFLGEDSDSFVTWLWDHLESNLSLYVQSREPLQVEAPKTKSASDEPAGRTESHHIDSEVEKENFKKTSANRHRREWKGLARDENENNVPLSQISMADKVNAQEDLHRRVGRTKRAVSPRSTIQKKRRQPEERQSRKREASQTTVTASRRLLQFAVRDAVASSTSRPSNTSTEPSLKRLRSVVSTSTGDSFVEERPQRIRPIAGLHTDMSAAIKAVTEAVKDVNKARPSRNVFDRLGRATAASKTTNHQEDYRGVDEDRVDADYSQEGEGTDVDYPPRSNNYIQQDANMSSFHDDLIIDSDLGYNAEGYDHVDVMGRGAMHLSQSDTSGGIWLEDSQMFPSSEAGDFDGRARGPHKDLDLPPASFSLRAASSLKMNTRRTPKYQDLKEVSEMDEVIHESDSLATKSDVWLMKENNNPIVAVNGNGTSETGPQHESQKTQTMTSLYSIGPPTEDADSRTIYVSNVNFAATKDSLSRHFNKFGEVLKVIILTDPATGQPKGSAYIEFTRKEAAEQALSLDSTSFMSRLLKIVRKSSAQPEVASAMAGPRIARGSPFPVPRFSRAPFARGIPSLYRSRVPIKSGPRSFQWKREALPIVAEPSGQAPTTRSLTYVRPDPKIHTKTNGSSGTA
ncbi:hypothetical protein ACJIZ3_007670 [Penstemon smallii]|uniref:RRM domain-containing protein n=1 Tax=Penstemon smallii TaxID=265156 RepID=A0ABD3T7L9_9LAMI